MINNILIIYHFISIKYYSKDKSKVSILVNNLENI